MWTFSFTQYKLDSRNYEFTLLRLGLGSAIHRNKSCVLEFFSEAQTKPSAKKTTTWIRNNQQKLFFRLLNSGYAFVSGHDSDVMSHVWTAKPRAAEMKLETRARDSQNGFWRQSAKSHFHVEMNLCDENNRSELSASFEFKSLDGWEWEKSTWWAMNENGVG